MPSFKACEYEAMLSTFKPVNQTRAENDMFALHGTDAQVMQRGVISNEKLQLL